jgi:hypothetical protein
VAEHLKLSGRIPCISRNDDDYCEKNVHRERRCSLWIDYHMGEVSYRGYRRHSLLRAVQGAWTPT